ncbi:FAD/NAD(P)-binding domain-containing protein [Nemania sp. NC0429]|nr:FAD/NAD(P)-binding domain-containing protein [Nemania sp. NC0429]
MGNPFRVIIVGAGPTGLAVGNMLAAAHVDFVILEQHKQVVTDSGACIMLWPHTARILDQLGLLEAARRSSLGLHSKGTIDASGRQLSHDPTFDWIRENHGYPVVHLPRTQLTELLFNGLEKHWPNIKTSSSISTIDVDEDGVSVTLSNGDVEKGSIIIGCDGVHSQVRKIMNNIASIDGVPVEESPQVTTFQCLFGTGLPVPNLEQGVFWESHGSGIATQFGVSGSGSLSAFSLFRRLDKPVEENRAYNTEDVAQFFESSGEVFIAPELQIKDLQKYCKWTRLAGQPEGCAKLWHHGRIVLCGESAVQMTSVAGMGFNVALQSAVFLVNRIYETIQANPNPGIEAITKAFSEYQLTREPETMATKDMSATYVRAVTWSSFIEKLVIEYLVPWVWGEKGMMKKLGVEMISQGRKLSFIPYDDECGTIPWAK